MAEVDFTRETGGNARPFGMPTLTIPKDFQLGKYDFQFWIETPEGRVLVRAYRDFCCKGTAKALEAAGLIEASWLPGIPGNNATRQTVIFEEGVSRLRHGRSTAKVNAPHIRFC